MSNLGFVDIILDNTNRLYSVAFSQFSWYKKVQGTEVLVTRIKENTKLKTVFGSIATSTLADDSETTNFRYVILISMNDMKKLYQKSIDPIVFYDNEDRLQIGDLLIFSRGVQEYKWKITDVQTFSEAGGVLQQYTITGLTEVNTLK